jgi:hypothetical protein
MAEQSENETGQSGEAPEGQTTGYRESADHIPDPTAMTGTLETTGTGGGVHERISGTTRIFGDVEQAIGKVEAVVAEHLHDIVDEVRGVLKREEANAQATALPQQTVENNGVPEHGGNIVGPSNDTGAGQDAPRSPNVAGDADGVNAGTEPVAENGAQDSYGQQTIAGASNPQDEADKAKAGEQRREGDGGGEQAEAKTQTKAPAKKAAAKKTSADK